METFNSNLSTDATPMDTASTPAPPPQQPDPPEIRSSPRLKRKRKDALSPIKLMDGKRLITQFEQTYIPPPHEKKPLKVAGGKKSYETVKKMERK